MRSFKLFNTDKNRLFVPCKERISNKNYFRFAYVETGIFPTQDVTAIFKKERVKESLHYILAILNNLLQKYLIPHLFGVRLRVGCV